MSSLDDRMSKIAKDNSLSLDFKNKVIELLESSKDFRNLKESESFSDILFTKFFGLNDEMGYTKIKAVLYELFCMCGALINCVNEFGVKNHIDKVNKENQELH